MNYQEFLLNIESAVAKRMPTNCQVHIQPFQKNNGVTYDGLIISNPQINISPTIYLNPYYHRYLSGVSLDEIYSDIISTYHRHQLSTDFDIEQFTNFEKVKSTIIMKIINYESNKEFLQNVSHMKYLDLAIIFQSLISCPNHDYGTITIQNSHIEEWGVTTKDLYKLALANMPRLLPCQLRDINDMVGYFPELSACIYVLTNNMNGATCMLYQGLLKKISEDFGTDLIIIPSSIYELIIIPTNDTSCIDFINDMICNVNSTMLTDEQILSDHVYYYSLCQDQLLIP